MRVALLLLAAAGALAYSEERQDDSRAARGDCPSWCPSTGGTPVCAKDQQGNYYKFTNDCWFNKCACKMQMTKVRYSRCPDYAPAGCPRRLARVAVDSDSDSDSDEWQIATSDRGDGRQQQQLRGSQEQQQQQLLQQLLRDSQEQQQQQQPSDWQQQSAPSDSLEEAHLGGNRLRSFRRH